MGPYRVKPKQLMTLVLSAHSTDGANGSITLAADVYFPDTPDLCPVLLMRQPYGRAIASTVVYAHPTWYASHGYIVVIQDVRGRGASGGDFSLFRHEAEDGYATVMWAANLPGSSGAVGMYGFSYQGMTQLYAAAQHPPPLQTIAPAMVGYDLYSDWAYENKALLLQAGLGWALQLAAETARRRGQPEDYQKLYQASRQMPLSDPIPANPQILRDLAPDSFFHDWLNHPQDNDYWQALSPDLTQVDLPMLHIGGWFDPYLRGDLRLYHQMVGQSKAPQHLWIGPWGHLPWGRRIGAVDFGPEANSPIDRFQLRWFDHHLKGQDTGLGQAPPVQLFAMGLNTWRGFSRWPEGQLESLYLRSSGLAGLDQRDGGLEPAPELDQLDQPHGQDVIVHDPWRPVPSLGGHSGIPAGPYDRAALDSRSDVLTYTTSPLGEALEVVGTPTLTLYGQVDAASFDISAVLSEVHANGQVINLTQGYIRVDALLEDLSLEGSSNLEGLAGEPLAATVQVITLPLQPTCFTIPPGHALRLSLAAACFPAYAVNSGTGQPAGEAAQIDHRIITVTICHGAIFPSRLELRRLK